MTTRRAFLFGLLTTPAIVRAEIFVPRGPILNPDHGPLRLCWLPETDGYDYGPFTEPIVANNGWTDGFVRRHSKSGNRLNLSTRQPPPRPVPENGVCFRAG
ncbi:MAG: hypothetical protein AAGF48_16000 [Pseudomonadota bacterium]